MKTLFHFSRLLFACLLLTSIGCKKDNDHPTDLSQYYRLQSYEVGVVPQSRTVQVLFQVTDFKHKGVSTLTEDDFLVSENDGRVDTEAEIRLGQSNIPYCLRTVLLLDISRSVEGFVPQIKTAAKALIQKKTAHQEIAIYTFDSGTKKLKAFTADQAALLAAVDAIPETGLLNSTNLYGAVIDVAKLWDDVFAIDGIIDGNIILFTDGRHNASQSISLSHAKAALGTKRVYAAALASPDLDEAALKSLATDTDRYFKADDVAGLEHMFLEIQSEIQSLSKSIYFLYYQSPITDPAPYSNKLTIEVKGNINTDSDSRIVEYFNSKGFGQ
jgi:uncharacterized protein YegL